MTKQNLGQEGLGLFVSLSIIKYLIIKNIYMYIIYFLVLLLQFQVKILYISNIVTFKILQFFSFNYYKVRFFNKYINTSTKYTLHTLNMHILFNYFKILKSYVYDINK